MRSLFKDSVKKVRFLQLLLIQTCKLALCSLLPVRLRYDVSTNSYYNNSRVKIHVTGFGKTSGVEYLNPGRIFNFVPYLHDMVEYFVDRGYVRGKSIRAAPYDWRLAAGMHELLHIIYSECFLSYVILMVMIYCNTCLTT